MQLQAPTTTLPATLPRRAGPSSWLRRTTQQLSHNRRHHALQPPTAAAAAVAAATVSRRGRRAAAASASAATTTTTATADSSQQQQQQQGDAPAFDWQRCWYPVAVERDLDRARPHADALLDLPIVLWHDGREWVAQADQCPHRLAPLSDGRITTEGQLTCSYHGWQFDCAGACTKIPQLATAEEQAAATGSRRSRVPTYPCKTAQGLVWVWPHAASADEAARAPLPLSQHFGADGWTMLGNAWSARDLMYGYGALAENLFDPSHIPFAHHGIMAGADREKVAPLDFATVEAVSPRGGFRLARTSAPFKTAAPTHATNTFTPPTLNTSVQTNQTTGRSLALTFYCVPTAPGCSRVFTGFFTTGKLPPPARWLLGSQLAAPFLHLGQQQVLDSDAFLLHVQERRLEQEGGEARWRGAFYLPASADGAIVAFRTWLSDCAGGGVRWARSPFGDDGSRSSRGSSSSRSSSSNGGGSSSGSDDAPLPQQQPQQPQQPQPPLGPPLPKEVVMDRYAQHTAKCRACSAALRLALRARAVALGVAALAGALATAAAAAAAAAASSSSAAAGGAAVGAAPTNGGGALLAALFAALPGGGGGGGWVLPAAAAAVALAALAAARALGGLAARFVYVGYDHALR